MSSVMFKPLFGKLKCRHMVAERVQHAASRKNTCKFRKQLRQYDNRSCKCSQHKQVKKCTANTQCNQTKKHAANTILYLVVLLAFAAPSVKFICRCFFYLHVFSEVAACWALGHRTYYSQWLVIIEVNPIPLSQIIRQYGLHFDCYADATQFLPVFVNESVGWRPKISCQQKHAFWILVTKKKITKTCETKSCVLPVSIIFLFPMKMFYESEEKFAHKTLFTSKNKCSLARSDSLKIKALMMCFLLSLHLFSSWH